MYQELLQWMCATVDRDGWLGRTIAITHQTLTATRHVLVAETNARAPTYTPTPLQDLFASAGAFNVALTGWEVLSSKLPLSCPVICVSVLLPCG